MKHQGKIQDISIHKTDRPRCLGDDATRPDPEVREKKPLGFLAYFIKKTVSVHGTLKFNQLKP